MAKDIKYRNIYGCIKHGTLHGKKGTCDVLNGKAPCFACDACKKVYLDPINDGVGVVNRYLKVNGEYYGCSKVVGPIVISDTIYVYNKETTEGLCICEGNLKSKTRVSNHIICKDGSVVSISGIRECNKCKKVFITNGIYKSNEELILNLGVNIVFPNSEENNNDDIELEMIPTEKKVEFNFDWEENIFEDITKQDKLMSIDELKPAGKVASAYYDAKISYNPYQYLPWLKMYINGCNKLLISDEVGLGKTIEAGILIMEELTENVNARILVVCPAFLREKWYQEMNEKFLYDPQVFDGKSVIDELCNIVILPISRISQFMDQADFYNFDMVIVDEIHYFKNAKSVRYEQLSRLLSKFCGARYVFMSATPVNNSGNDYQSIEKLFGSKPDKTNTTKKQAYINLPDRHVHDVFVDLSNDEQSFYEVTDALDPFSGTIYRHIGASCLYALGKYAYSGEELSAETKEELRASIEMLAEAYEYSEDAECINIRNLILPEVDSKLEELKRVISGHKEGSKVVVFTHYIETVKYLHSELSKEFSVGYVYANNISNNIPCKHIKNRFIDAKAWFSGTFEGTAILICSDSCREGIDLDVANILVNYDLPFNPSILEQRIGRIDRMSQKRDMEIYNFHVNNTYDDRLHFILSTKLRFINFYADYGIGNPLNITADGDATFNNFIRYFTQRNSADAVMSNDDFYVSSKLLRMIGVKLEKRDGIDALQMQRLIIDNMNLNRKKIEEWFENGELRDITDEQLIARKDKLNRLLGFPPKIKRILKLDDKVKKSVVEKANTNPFFRKRISALIDGYSSKLIGMEITGLPMTIMESDIRDEYVFGTGEADAFIQSSVIEIMRNEGAMVYEIG